MSLRCREFRLPPLVSDTSWDSAHVSVGRQRQGLQCLRNRMERQWDVCLPILAGSAKALRDLDSGWSKDETGVAIWTLGKQGMKNRTCKHTNSKFCLLTFYSFWGFFAIVQTWWNDLFFLSVRIKILPARSENPSQSIKKSLFVFQFLKALIHHYNWFWPIFASLSFNHHPRLNEFRLWLCASDIKEAPERWGNHLSLLLHALYSPQINTTPSRNLFIHTTVLASLSAYLSDISNRKGKMLSQSPNSGNPLRAKWFLDVIYAC